MAAPSEEEGAQAPRKRAKRFGKWMVGQVLWIVIRHFLSSWWNDNGPTW